MLSLRNALFGFAVLSVLLTGTRAVEDPFLPDDIALPPRPVPKPKAPEPRTAPPVAPPTAPPTAPPSPAVATIGVERKPQVTDPVLKATPSGPAQTVVRSSSVNVTTTPTTGQTQVAAERRASKPAPASLLDVKVKNTTVTISPMGVIRTRNPDVDIDALKVAQVWWRLTGTLLLARKQMIE